MEVILRIFKEFKPLTIVGIVIVTLVLLGSFVIKYEDGSFEFRYSWAGLGSQENANSLDDLADGQDKTDDEKDKTGYQEDKADSLDKINSPKGKSEERHAGNIIKLISTIISFFEKLR